MVFEARFERARMETSPSAVLCSSAQPESPAARGCAHVHPHLIDGQQESDEDTVLLQIAQAADIGRAREADEGHAVKNMDAGVQSAEEPNSSRLGVEQLDSGWSHGAGRHESGRSAGRSGSWGRGHMSTAILSTSLTTI